MVDDSNKQLPFFQVKEKKGLKKPPLIDLSSLRSQAAQMLLLASAVAGFGLYTPVFFLVRIIKKTRLSASRVIMLKSSF